MAGLERTSHYQRWQLLIESEFLSSADGPTVLFLDDDELRRLRPDVDDPASELVHAVRELVDPALGPRMFDRISTMFRRWDSSPRTGPPPVLPLLGLTVLAATRMRSDGAGRRSNYYLRLAQALVPDGNDTEVEFVRSRLGSGGAFAAVVDMWRALDKWIEAQGGSAGVSTIPSDPQPKRIGYPLSQAIVRASDRAVLTKFFAALELRARSVPEEGVLLRYLDHWGDRPRGFSESFLTALTDEDLIPLLSALVHRLAVSWDGQVRTEEGRRRIELALSLDLEEWSIRWLVAAEGGPDGLALAAPDSTVIELARENENPFYVGTVPDVRATEVLNGLRLSGNEYTAEFPRRRVIAFRKHPYTGTWVSHDGLVPFQEHVIGVAADVANDARRALEQATGSRVRQVPQPPRYVLIEGFALFEGVRFDDCRRMESALHDFPLLGKLGLSLESAARPRLVWGLPLAKQVSRSCYLRDGVPDLELPSSAEPRRTTVTLDGISQDFVASGFPVELRRLRPPLETGNHVIVADGERLEFRILDAEPGSDPRPGSGTYAWSLAGVLTESGPDSVVCGVLVDPPDEAPPLLARRGKDETVVLHDNGRVEQISEPAYPALLEGNPDGARPLYFEVSTKPSARWLAQRRLDRWTVTSADPWSNAPSYTLAVNVPDLWQQLRVHEPGTTLWEWYLDASQGDT